MILLIILLKIDKKIFQSKVFKVALTNFKCFARLDISAKFYVNLNLHVDFAIISMIYPIIIL